MNLVLIALAGLIGFGLGAYLIRAEVMTVFKEKDSDKYSFGRVMGSIVLFWQLIYASYAATQAEKIGTFPDIPDMWFYLIVSLFGITTMKQFAPKK